MKNRILTLSLIFLLFSCHACFADTVRWKVSADGTLLGDQFVGKRNEGSENWALGIWKYTGKCTQSYPCFSCSANTYYEFLPDGVFQYREEGGGPQCVPGHAPQKENPPPKDIQKKSGTYKVIDRNTVELSAPWEIEDNSLAGSSQRCFADEDCVVVLLPKLFGPGGCSPPCGSVYNVVPGAMNKGSVWYVETLKQEEEGKYTFGCDECEGAPPQIPDVSSYRAVCQNSRCLVKEKDK